MATPEQIERALRNAHAAGDTVAAQRLARAYKAATVSPAPVESFNPTDGMSTTDLLLAGAGSGLTNVARGVGQRTRDVLPDKWADEMGLPTEVDVAEARRLDKPLMDTLAGKIGGFVGEAAPYMLLPGGKLAKTIGTGAAVGALTPTAQGESPITNALMGGAGGLLAHGAIAGLGRVLRPVRSQLNPKMTALAEKAKTQGIDLNAAQLTDSKPLKWINSVMDDLPLTAAAQQSAKEAQRKQFNAAVAKTMGTRAEDLGENVMASTKSRVGGAIGDIADRNKFNLDNDTFNKLVQNKFDAQRFETKDVRNIANNYIDDFFAKVEPDGKVSGEAYRKLDSELSRRMRGTTNGDLKHALGQIRDTLREGMDKSISPQDAAAWSRLRGQYRNMKLIEPLAAKSVDGNISPTGLLAASIKKDSNAAYKSNTLKDLGKIGKTFLGEPPSSGTAQRNFYTQMLTNPVNLTSSGLGFLAGGTPGAALGGLLSTAMTSGAAAVPLQKLMNSKAGKQYLTTGMLKSLQRLEDPAQRYLSAPVGAGLLINMSQQ